jgi:hypothetical protein
MNMGTYVLFKKVKNLVFIKFLRKYNAWFMNETMEIKNDLVLLDLMKLCKTFNINSCKMVMAI